MQMASKQPPSTRRGHAPPDARARLAEHLARAGLKRSRARDVVVDTFLATKGHVSAEELTELVRRREPGIGFTTVYRALKLLVAAGLAAERQFGDGRARWEPVLAGEHHDHLICTACGAIVEFEDAEIEALQLAVARRHGFQVTSHRMELLGRCAACARAARGPTFPA